VYEMDREVVRREVQQELTHTVCVHLWSDCWRPHQAGRLAAVGRDRKGLHSLRRRVQVRCRLVGCAWP
jgi:hypothetical protein